MRLVTILVLCAALAACHAPTRSAAEPLAALEAISADVSARGPIAWLDWFEPGDAFFMVSEGLMALDGYEDARQVVTEFDASVDAIDLRWVVPRVEWRAPDLVSFATAYAEDIVYLDGREDHYAGYVTGLLRRTGGRWRIADLHWSAPVTR